MPCQWLLEKVERLLGFHVSRNIITSRLLLSLHLFLSSGIGATLYMREIWDTSVQLIQLQM